MQVKVLIARDAQSGDGGVGRHDLAGVVATSEYQKSLATGLGRQLHLAARDHDQTLQDEQGQVMATQRRVGLGVRLAAGVPGLDRGALRKDLVARVKAEVCGQPGCCKLDRVELRSRETQEGD